MMRMVLAALILLPCVPLLAGTREKAGTVTLDVVKYDGLKEAILKRRGKVVYVDFWYLNCPPCKAAFPHLVALHDKHHKEGLEIVTVNINAEELPAEENLKKSLAFLESTGAVFRNLILDEGDDIWADKLQISTFPSIYLFDRRGRWTHFDGKTDKKEVDRLIENLLKETVKK